MIANPLSVTAAISSPVSDHRVQETAGLASPASVPEMAGSAMFATAAFVTSVHLTTSFGMPLGVTVGHNREASISSCLHLASGAFVIAATANPIT